MQKGKLKKPKETCKKKNSGPSPELWITIVLVLLILLAIPLIMMIDFFAYWIMVTDLLSSFS
ncbi:hypothetical protein [Mesobacillus subterraneus]|uniref:Uncharacterized protein n=1 Tax=Mesobacillus subterraneus TaxID=285983 RepID=A0A427TVI9_9BACI|nr:hypothetical protein [Mesobacillus subterraneus]RSD28414.1 hypothetical protein EJA10_04835 [Mesobacillus subterraneus]